VIVGCSVRRDPAAFLWDVRDTARRNREFVDGLAFGGFSEGTLVQSAVERQFEITGEALSQLSRIAPKTVAAISEAPRIIAFRNILVHAYAVVDQSVVWPVIQEDLPLREATVQELLKAEPPPSTPE
jgi:uncharacterized protein with HEPN domain